MKMVASFLLYAAVEALSWLFDAIAILLIASVIKTITEKAKSKKVRTDKTKMS